MMSKFELVIKIGCDVTLIWILALCFGASNYCDFVVEVRSMAGVETVVGCAL